jgi:Fur family iron response transcriptional regulator
MKAQERMAEANSVSADDPKGNVEAKAGAASGARSLAGCPVHSLREKLRAVGLRPTRQRTSLGWLLFAKGDRHVSAEILYEEAMRARVPVSLATVYNTLHQFTQVGLLREIAADGAKTYFDTNPSDHHHFYIEGEDRMIDVPPDLIRVDALPELPEGMEVARIEVIVRLRPKAGVANG